MTRSAVILLTSSISGAELGICRVKVPYLIKTKHLTGDQGMHLMTESIGNLIFLPRFILKVEGLLLEIGRSFSMAITDPALATEITKSLMIRLYNKLLVKEVGLPKLKRLDDGIKLKVVSGVIQCCPYQLQATEGDQPSILTEDCSYDRFASIAR